MMHFWVFIGMLHTDSMQNSIWKLPDEFEVFVVPMVLWQAFILEM